MSDPKNYGDYFSKIKDGIKNFEYRAHAHQIKEKLSDLQQKASSSDYLKKAKEYKENLQNKLKNERPAINQANNRSYKSQDSHSESIFTKAFDKTKTFTNQIKNSVVEGKVKDNLVDIANKVKDYEYSKKISELSAKTQQKINEANIPEKIKTIKEKANETAQHYQVKEKIEDFSEKSKETAKSVAKKSKESLGKTTSFLQNKIFLFGGKFRDFGRQKAKTLFGGVLLVIFVYGFGTSLPKAYYDYKRYSEEKEFRREQLRLKEEK